MLNKRYLPTRVVASSLAALMLLSTAGSNVMTIKASATETTTQARFIPFRSSIVSYITEHSADKGQNIIDEWLRIWAEQSTYSGGASAWANKYYSEYKGDGGEFVSDSQAKGRAFIYNKEFDSYLANTIKANGLDFMNQWLNANGTVAATGGKFSGETVFINYFNGTAYQDYISTSLAIISLTQTPEGKAWLQNYSYAKTGNKEASVGVGLLKLLTLNWEKLDDDQMKWCKEYLPYLLMNYRDYGTNAIAANAKNPTLYDFMARSVNGAQCTYTSKVSKKVMQQEFYDYVVASGKGYGEFVQNIIGGGTYTATANGRTFSGIDLKDILDTSTLHRAPNANVDYTATDEGDGDYDWFNHAMYLYSKNGSNSQFATIYKLVMNNKDAKKDYAYWLANFHGKKGETENWNKYLSNQTSNTNNITVSGVCGSSTGFMFASWETTNSTTGKTSEGDPATITSNSNNAEIVSGYNFGRTGQYFRSFGWDRTADGSWTWNKRLNEDYVNFNTVTINLNVTSPVSNGIQVQVLGGSKTGTVVASAWTTNKCSLTITPDQWANYKDLYLKIYIPSSTLVKMGNNVSNNARGFSVRLSGVTFEWTGSQQKCIDGHNFEDYTYSYSSDYKEVVVSHKCKTCGVKESELLSVDNKKVIVDDTDEKQTVYKYKPALLNLNPWEKTISKDLGTGTVSFDKTSSYASGNWSAYNNHPTINHSHRIYGPTQIRAVTSESVIAESTATIKSGAIKANVQSVTATGANTNPKEFFTVSVYDKYNALLKSNSGYGTVTVDLSDISITQKDGCHISVYHSRSITHERLSEISSNWGNYPASFELDVKSTLNNITVTY